MYLGYVRVSTGKQTFENQMFAIEDFCAHQNPPIHIDDWIIETASGMKHFDKRKLGKKLQSVTSDDTIISTEITRLGRSLLMIFSIMGMSRLWENVTSASRIRCLKIASL